MTANQIKFAELQEARRHNLQVESKDTQAVAESVRHNKVTEEINWYDAGSRRSQAAASLSQASSAAVQAANYGRSVDVQEKRAPFQSFSDVGNVFAKTLSSVVPVFAAI